MKTWFSNLREPMNIIALAILILTGFSLSAGGRFFANIQSVTGENGCAVDDITQEGTSGAIFKQTVDCKNDLMIIGAIQNQRK